MKWKKQLLEELPSIFSDKRVNTEEEREDLEAELHRQIGRLKVELEWFKNLSSLVEERRKMIEPTNPLMPVYIGNVSL